LGLDTDCNAHEIGDKMLKISKGITAVLQKDIKSEFKTRYSISTLLLFVLTAVTMLGFSLAGVEPNTGQSSGLLWVIMFFAAMTGLSKSFISEEERETSLLLKLTSSPTNVYFGKLIFNILLSLVISIATCLLFFLFAPAAKLNNLAGFTITIILGALGLASASTIISAMIAKASAKGALFPVLSFPILLPLIIVGIDSTTMSFEGKSLSEISDNFQIMLGYCGAVISLSFILFEFIWKD